MSEKRFKMGESDIQGEMMFIDTQTNKIYWQEYFDEIVDLVNEQQATINKFREEELYVQDTLRFYYSQIEQKKHKIQILEKKNKQLEEENECLRDFINLFNMRQKWKLYNFAMKNRDCDNDE